MELKIKKLNQKAIIPQKAHDNDAAYDLYATNNGNIKVLEVKQTNGKKGWRIIYIEYPIGLAIEPPVGYHIEIVSRSSVSNTDLILANCLAVGDQGYRGEYRLRFKIPALSAQWVTAESETEAISLFNLAFKNLGVLRFSEGDKIAQMLIRKTEHMDIIEESDLTETQRGEGGFGSTGK